jgi:hypothetical protein
MKKFLALPILFACLSRLYAQVNNDVKIPQSILEQQLTDNILGILFHVQSGNG